MDPFEASVPRYLLIITNNNSNHNNRVIFSYASEREKKGKQDRVFSVAFIKFSKIFINLIND
jgi:hypothetical protein